MDQNISSKKLSLRRESITSLSTSEMSAIEGGMNSWVKTALIVVVAHSTLTTLAFS